MLWGYSFEDLLSLLRPEDLLAIIGLHALLDVLVEDLILNLEWMLAPLILVVNSLTVTAFSHVVGQFEDRSKSVLWIVEHLGMSKIVVAICLALSLQVNGQEM